MKNISILKSLKILFLIFFLNTSISYSNILITPADFNLTIKKGSINRDAMAQRQRDTIVVGVFDYEDDFEDIAVYHPSKKQIIVYKNLRNGFATPYRIIDMFEKNVKSIKGIYPEPNLESFHKRTGLEITMFDGSKEILTDFEIYRHGIPEIEKARVPKWDIFQDPRIFVYNISFIQKWQSERNGVPHYRFTVGDIDKDGKDELIWTFYPIADTLPFPVFEPTRLVVFEYVNENSVRIDWDTVLYHGGGNYGFGITDYDNDGNNEFMGWAYFTPLGGLRNGFFECYGEGQYRYLYSSYDINAPWSVEYRDSVTFNGVTAKGMWLLSGGGWGNDHNVKLLRFSGSSQISLGFNTVISRGGIGYVYHMSAGDLDRDGKEEIVLGRSQWGGYTPYLDSTGSGPSGYEEKLINPSPPGAAGFSFFKDYNGDGFQELTVAGIGQGSGGLSILKHTGEPGTNSFQIVWSDVSMFASPNRGIDTNYIGNEFCLLYPIQYYTNWIEYQNTIIYQLVDTFAYEQIYNHLEDSISYLSSKLYDLGNAGKMNLITPIRFQNFTSGNAFLTILEMQGTIGINPISSEIPCSFELYQNYPNPFNNKTKISFVIHKPGKYSLKVFDVSGREIATLVNSPKFAGNYEVTFNAGSLSSGVYFYRLQAGDFVETKRMTVLK